MALSVGSATLIRLSGSRNVYFERNGSELSFSGEPELELELLLLLRLPPVEGETGSELLACRESPTGRLAHLCGDSMPLVKLGTERDCHSN